MEYHYVGMQQQDTSMANRLTTESEREFLSGEKEGEISDPRGYKSNVLYRLGQRKEGILEDLRLLQDSNLEAYDTFTEEDDPNADFEEFVDAFVDDLQSQFSRERELERRVEELEKELEGLRDGD